LINDFIIPAVLIRKLEFDLELTLRLVLLPYRHSEKCSATYVRRLVAPSNYQNNGTAIPINRKLDPKFETSFAEQRHSTAKRKRKAGSFCLLLQNFYRWSIPRYHWEGVAIGGRIPPRTSPSYWQLRRLQKPGLSNDR